MCDALLDLVRYVQFKKREKYPWRRDTFSKDEGLRKGGCMGVFHVFQIVRMVPNRAKRHMYYTFLLVPSFSPRFSDSDAFFSFRFL